MQTVFTIQKRGYHGYQLTFFVILSDGILKNSKQFNTCLCMLFKFLLTAPVTIGDSTKYSYHTTEGFSEFRGQGGLFELEIRRHGGDTYDWNSKGMGRGD